MSPEAVDDAPVAIAARPEADGPVETKLMLPPKNAGVIAPPLAPPIAML